MAQQRDPGEPRSRAVVATTAVLGRLREGSTEDPPIVRDTSWRQLSASVKSSSKLRALGAACPATPAGLRPKLRRQGDAEAVVRRTQVAISSGVYSLVGVLIGGGIATASQVHLEQGRERHRQRADERLLRASKREIAAELFDIAMAARTVSSQGEADANHRHLFRRSEQ